MNKRFNAACAMALAFALPLAPLALVSTQGCGSLNKTSYKVAQGSAITVDAAMSAWGSYVSVNHPPVEKERQVKAAYDTYVKAALIVADAGIAYNRAKEANTPDVGAQQATLQSALNAAANSLNGLVDLLRQLGVRI